jgi:cytidylate kinase
MGVITVSRHPGSLGDTLARALAERLSYRLVERNELIQLAERIGGPDIAWERSPELRERSPSFWERLNEERRRYASVLRRVTTHLAEEDDVVIAGLGAGQLLKGLSHVLRLQVVAPVELRLERVMERGFDDIQGPLTRERARDLIRSRDREAAGYMRYLFNIDWMDPQYWDMVINTGRFTVPQAAEIVAAVVENGLLEPSLPDRQRLANLVLASRVESTVLGDPSVWVNGLKVVAQDGHVRLEGEVITEDDRDAVEQVVRAIEGVTAIDNDLRVQPPPLTGM